MGGSLSFDRAASYYDETRITDPRTLDTILGLLADHVVGDGPVLEVGVGTGQLALPLAGRGVRVVGLDLSTAMMARLIEKAGGVSPVNLVQADATRIPFSAGVFAGAYARWVLHLIPEWERVLRELDRVVREDGKVAIEPGGFAGPFRDVFLRYHEVLGDVALPPGLHPVHRDEQLDEAMAGVGWMLDRVEEVTYDPDGSLATFFDDVSRRRHSWTWGVPDDALGSATVEVRAWAEERYDLTGRAPAAATRWRVYGRG